MTMRGLFSLTTAMVPAAALLLLALLVAGIADPARAGVTDLTVIPLKSGLNYIDDFATDGRRGLIVVGWRDNGDAWGYHVYLVMLKLAAETDAWEVVTAGTGQQPGGDGVPQVDIIRDTPHTVEDAIASVRFAHGRVDGQPATLLIIARREVLTAPSVGSATPVAFDIFRLIPNGGDVGRPSHYFARIDTLRTAKRYCNADLALNKELHLPLPQPYVGPNLEDGCPK